MNAELSIIVPIYNAEQYLDRCIESIVQQSFCNLQIILVDDGSTDKSSLIIDRWAGQDSRIVRIHQKNGGVSKARNAGIAYACGKWVAFVDADDYLLPVYCEKVLKAAEQSDADVLLSAGAFRDNIDYGEQVTQWDYETQERVKLACIAYDENAFSINIDAPWGKLFRREILQENQILFPEQLTRSEDAVFCVTFYEHTDKIAIYNCAGYVHTENEGSLCRSYSPKAQQTLLSVLRELEKWVADYHPQDMRYKQALYYRVLPGINECEQIWLLHPDNPMTKLQKLQAYTALLKVPKIKKAIKNLDSNRVTFRPYQKRLKLYKTHMGWVLIGIKLLKE